MKYIDMLREKFVSKWGIGSEKIQKHVLEGLTLQFLENISISLEFLVNVEKAKFKKELEVKTVKELQDLLVEYKVEIKDLKKEDLIDFYISKKY